MERYIPVGATHERDGDFYKVSGKVEYYDPVEETWNNCKDMYDISGWLEELTKLD